MIDLTVFLSAFLGALGGVLTAVIPVVYLLKKKWEKSPMGAMLG